MFAIICLPFPVECIPSAQRSISEAFLSLKNFERSRWNPFVRCIDAYTGMYDGCISDIIFKNGDEVNICLSYFCLIKCFQVSFSSFTQDLNSPIRNFLKHLLKTNMFLPFPVANLLKVDCIFSTFTSHWW